MTTIQLRRGTSQEWVAANPILAPGEVGVELDTNKFKLGDGVTYWSVAEYYVPAPDVMAAIQAEMASHLAAANPHPQYGSASGLPDHIAAADPHPQYATDSDLAAHVAHANPHPVYATDVDLNTHIAAADPHPVYATDADLTAHVAAANPHPVYATDSDLLNHRTDPDAHPQYASDEEFNAYVKVADVVYEKKSVLLNEAAWWVDASAAKNDRLVDLSGNGHDAIFGADTAAPIILPWDNEDYIYTPLFDSINYLSQTPMVVPFTSASWEVDFVLLSTPTGLFKIMESDAWNHGAIRVGPDMKLQINIGPGGAYFKATTALVVGKRHKIKVDATTTTCTITIDGVQAGSGPLIGPVGTLVGPAWRTIFSGQGGVGSAYGYRYSEMINGGITTILEPKNVNADYTWIKNTGNSGGDWLIQRAASGYKLSVVNRPLLMFGGGQAMTVASAPTGIRSFILAYRAFGTMPGVENVIKGTVNQEPVIYDYLDRSRFYFNYVKQDTARTETQGMDYGPSDGEYVVASTIGNSYYRVFNKFGTYTQKSDIVREFPSSGWLIDSGSSRELIAYAAWNRELTPAEVAQVSQDLIGITHTEQLDPHPQYITQSEGDFLYESKSELLREAAWHVDAAVLSPDKDRLIDITGRGRDAIFGANTARPVVLPWSGQDYLHSPVTGGGVTATNGVGDPATIVVVTIEGSLVATSNGEVFDGLFGGAPFWLCSISGGHINSVAYDASAVSEGRDLGAVVNEGWHRFTKNGLNVAYETSVDGLTWTLHGSNVHTGARTTASKCIYSLMGGGYSAVGAGGDTYSATVSYDGAAPAYVFDPRNVNSDYTKIKNTGSQGGDWVIQRLASGFKTAVVDRPLLLTGHDTAEFLGYPPLHVPNFSSSRVFTWVMATRKFGMAGNYDDNGLYNGSNPGVLFDYVPGNANAHYAYMYKPDGTVAAGITIGNGLNGQHVAAIRYDGATASVFLDGKAGIGPLVQVVADFSTKANLLILASAAREFIAAAIFDRALTDYEITQVSAELAGVSHTEQKNPHPQYGWKSVTLWADLPSVGDFEGQKIRVTSGLGLCVAMWNGTAWVVAPESDTGWQFITLTPGAYSITRAQLRRVGNDVHSSIWVNPTESTMYATAALYVYPKGWRPAISYPTFPAGALANNDILQASFSGDSQTLRLQWPVFDMNGQVLLANWIHILQMETGLPPPLKEVL